MNYPTSPNRRSDGTIAAVVVAFRSAATIERCIASLLADSHLGKVVIVDNSSDHATRKIVEDFHTTDNRVHYFEPGSNVGFAKGCNLGAQFIVGYDFLFLVNPDVELKRRLSDLAHFCGPDTQIVGARLRTASGINARVHVTRCREILKGLVGPRTYTRRLEKCLATQPHKASLDVEQVDGALLGISMVNWRALGGLDERFELYYEDVDVCARALNRGSITFVTEEWGTHIGGASSGRTPRITYLVSRISRIRYLRKHYGNSIGTIACIGFMALVEFLARSVSFRSEGWAVRLEGLRLQAFEVFNPGAVLLLER